MKKRFIKLASLSLALWLSFGAVVHAQQTTNFWKVLSSKLTPSLTSWILGVGTSTPYASLTVWGKGTGAGTLFELVDNASSTRLSVLDDGTVSIPTITSSLVLTGSTGTL